MEYSPAGGVVRLRLGQRGGQAEIAVMDRGIGIPRAEHTAIFEPFAHGSTAPSIAEGTGLGLYITAKIAERHGGSISLQSEPGQGSTITVRLPLSPPPSVGPILCAPEERSAAQG